ncbi:MAG: hypothetical protein NZO16_01155 [Deltaproteobacteria bacterium]|nr:hypothetical protein [Deltaproteobacteria bacterium]
MEYFKLIISLPIFGFFLGLFYSAGISLNARIVSEDAVTQAARVAVTRGRRGAIWLDPRRNNQGLAQNFTALGRLLDDGQLTAVNQHEIPQEVRQAFSSRIDDFVNAIHTYNRALRTANNLNNQNEFVRLHISHLMAIALANTYLRNSLGPGSVTYPCADTPNPTLSCFTCVVGSPLGDRCVNQVGVEVPPESFRLICRIQLSGLLPNLFDPILRIFNAGQNALVFQVQSTVSYPSMLIQPWTRLL